MIYNDENIDYIAVVYKQKNNKLIDVFTSVEAYESFMKSVIKDNDFTILDVYSGDFIK